MTIMVVCGSWVQLESLHSHGAILVECLRGPGHKGKHRGVWKTFIAEGEPPGGCEIRWYDEGALATRREGPNP